MDVINSSMKVVEIPPSASLLEELVDFLYPIGSIYMSAGSQPPKVGTWVPYLIGRAPLGVGTSDQVFAAGTAYGASNVALSSVAYHTHTQGSLSITIGYNSNSHTHNMRQPLESVLPWSGAGSPSEAFVPVKDSTGLLTNGFSTDHTHSGSVAINTELAGQNIAHNNLPPYIVVNAWRRMA